MMAGEGRSRRARSKPTAEDVARIASVSRSTVSRTFTAGAQVDPDTRTRVMEAARKVGYHPRTGLSAPPRPAGGRTIGLIMGGLDNPFYQRVLASFLDQLHARGLRAICRTATAPEGTEGEVRTMLDQGVDAMIVASSGLRSTALERCSAAGVPLVLFNRAIEGATASSVQTDNVAGGRVVADLLALGGHRRIAFVNGLEGASTNRDRLAGFSARLAELGLDPPLQEYGEYTYEGGREAVRRLMTCAEPPEAIFVANDISAFGVLDGLRADLGIAVPEAVSVVGFDDVPMAGWPSFNLTTVRQRRNRMIASAMTMLDDILAGLDGPPRTVLVEGRLIVRGSVRLPKRVG